MWKGWKKDGFLLGSCRWPTNLIGHNRERKSDQVDMTIVINYHSLLLRNLYNNRECPNLKTSSYLFMQTITFSASYSENIL